SLAEEWNVSGNGRIYNFKIRKNVYFHNGRRMTAYDVKHTLERVADPRNPAASKDWLFKYLPIKGLKKFQQDCRNKVQNPDLAGVSVLDNDFVQIALDNPSPFLLKELALPIFSITPKEEIDKWGSEFKFHPSGTGPYSMEVFDKNKVVLKQNTRYFG